MKRVFRTSLALLVKIRLSRLIKNSNFKRIDHRIERLILRELGSLGNLNLHNQNFSQNISLNLSQNQIYTNLENLEVLRLILKTRGRLRWLCFRLMPLTFSDSYEVTRRHLLFRIFKNWALFAENVLSKLSIVSELLPNYEQIEFYEFTHPNNRFFFTEDTTYILGHDLSKSMLFSRKKLAREIDTILGRMIIWNSRAAIRFIRSSAALSVSTKVFDYLKSFPDVLNELQGYSKLSLEFHKSSELSFDELLSLGVGNAEVLTDVEIWHQRFIIKSNKWHVIDSTCSPYSEFVAGHWQFLEQIPTSAENVYLKNNSNSTEKALPRAIYLMGRADENWYHLLLDTLPRYLLLKDLDSDIPVLIRSDLPETSKQLIEKLVEREIIYVDPQDRLYIKTLYFVAARSTVHDSRPKNAENQVKFSPKMLGLQREWIMSRLPASQDHFYPERIFFPRRAKYRNLLNMNSVIEYMMKQNYQIVELNNIFFLDQHHFFSSAKTVITPGGALLANILFMHKNSNVVAIRSWRDSELKLWKDLAYACEINYSEVVGIPTYFGSNSLARQHSNFFVPLSRIKEALRS